MVLRPAFINVNDRLIVHGDGSHVGYADIHGVCRENCMVVASDPGATGEGPRIFVSAGALWNHRQEEAGWLFTRTGDAYCGIKVAHKGYTVYEIAEKGYDLALADRWAPVVIQMGCASEYDSFDDFRHSVKTKVLTYTDGKLVYTSEAGDTYVFHSRSTTIPEVNGTAVELNPIKTYNSPYLSLTHGESVATFRYAGYPDLILDFSGKAPLLSVLQQ